MVGAAVSRGKGGRGAEGREGEREGGKERVGGRVGGKLGRREERREREERGREGGDLVCGGAQETLGSTPCFLGVRVGCV